MTGSFAYDPTSWVGSDFIALAFMAGAVVLLGIGMWLANKATRE